MIQKLSGKERRLKSLAAIDQPRLALRSPDLLAKTLLLRSLCPWLVSAEGLIGMQTAGETLVPREGPRTGEQALSCFCHVLCLVLYI